MNSQERNKIINFIKKHYPTKGSNFCAIKLNRSRKSITDYAFYYDIKFKVNHFNPIEFINVKRPEIAYLLGLLWGDGYLERGIRNYRISITALATDLEPLKNIFMSSGPWRCSFKYIKNRKLQLLCRLGSKKLYFYLSKYGYKAKSCESACKILSKIPKNLHKYWFRGIVDADGCFYANTKTKCIQFCCSSSVDQNWTYFINLFKNLNIQNYKIKKQYIKKENKTHSSSKIRICSIPHIIKFGNYIYQNYPADEIGFERKYKKFQEIVNYYNSKQKLL